MGHPNDFITAPQSTLGTINLAFLHFTKYFHSYQITYLHHKHCETLCR